MSASLKIETCRVGQGWSPEVDVVISALEAGRGFSFTRNRRTSSRLDHRVVAHLRLFADEPGTEPWVIYTRDVDPRGVGFVSRERLPLGYSGTVEMFGPHERPFSAACTVHRSRECGPDWFEGSLFFHNQRSDLIVPMRLTSDDDAAPFDEN